MRKVKNENVFEITEDVKVGNGVILESGDKIRVLKESNIIQIECDVALDPEDIYEWYQRMKAKYHVKMIKKTSKGPGGGWPNVVLEGNREDLQRLIQREFDEDDLDLFII